MSSLRAVTAVVVLLVVAQSASAGIRVEYKTPEYVKNHPREWWIDAKYDNDSLEDFAPKTVGTVRKP